MAKRYVDLTGTFAPGMWSYRLSITDLPAFEYRRWATVEERGWEADYVALPTLCGTYLETSKHLFPDRPPIADIPPERLFLRATIAKVPKERREHVTADDLAAASPGLQPGDALLVSTGWDHYWWDDGTVFVMESPHFDLGAMEWIVDHGVAILGADMPCFDDPQPGGGQNVNDLLFRSDALILAPLVGLGTVTAPHAHLVVLPIKLGTACGAPCRAILIEEDPT